MPVVQTFAELIKDNMPAIQSMIEKLTPVLVEMIDKLLPILVDLANTLLPVIFDKYDPPNLVGRSTSRHQFERMDERGVTIQDVKNALVSPLHVCDVRIDAEGQKSQRFIGRRATVNINPDTGIIITTWKTGMDKLKKYKGSD